MNIDKRKLLEDVINREMGENFARWLQLANKTSVKIISETIGNSYDLRMRLLGADIEAEEGNNYIAYIIKEKIKTSLIKIEDLEDTAPIVVDNGLSILPDYSVVLKTYKKCEPVAEGFVVVLGKFVNDYRLHTICDLNTWDFGKSESKSSRAYAYGNRISKQEAITLGFKYVRVGD